jgi:photosystem II cytochrome c550
MLMQVFSRSVWRRSLLVVWIACLSMVLVSPPAYAVDPYIRRYLQVTEPVPLVIDDRGTSRFFSEAELISGKKLFEQHCASCHVGGTTLPNPPVSLALDVLRNATPPRDTISHLVEYMRHPMSYDGSEESFLCREVPQSWLSQSEVETLAGFILRAAQKAPGWGTASF